MTSSTAHPRTTTAWVATPQTTTPCTSPCGSCGDLRTSILDIKLENPMNKLFRFTVLAAGLLLAGAAFAADHVVQELNNGPDGPFTYGPTYLLIQPGDTVTFQPTDQGHNSESVFMPEGATGWKS